jgi:hypothetical protein
MKTKDQPNKLKEKMMPQIQICHWCHHVVNPEEDQFVILRDDVEQMHVDCYEEELTKKEEKTKGAEA